MSLGIIRGELEDVLERLKEDDFDDDEYPISRYDTSYDVSIDGDEIDLLPGTQTDPVSEFVLKYGENEFTFDKEPPGILPYISGGFQIKGGDPSPIDVGLPHIANERGGKIAVRWLFTEIASASDGLSEWGRLHSDDVEGIREVAKPDKDTVIENRQGKSPSPVITYPETVETVESRKEDYWWEAWCARRQEIMSSWRVLIPNTSKTPLPTVLSPENTVVADNFNIAVLPDGETAVAVAAVLGTQKSQDFLKEISPWASGDTPRPRVKHVCATIHQNKGIIESVLDDKQSELSTIASNLGQFHTDLNEALRSYLRVDEEDTERFRARFTGISDQDAMSDEIEGVTTITDTNAVVLETSRGDVEVEFHEADYAAGFAAAAWLATGFGDPVNLVLDVPASQADLDAVQQTLCECEMGEFRETVLDNYY